jgi:hypothetical protein
VTRLVWSAGVLALLALAHEGLALLLDRAELIERLLSPGPAALVALPAAALLYVLRLGLVFLGPGLLALAVVRAMSRLGRPLSGPAP